MIAALILGRKGSIGLPNKNLYMVEGHPLAWYPIRAAKETNCIDRIFLSTDDDRLINIANEENIEIIKRPEYLCSSGALSEDAFYHGYMEICNRTGNKPELMVLLFCNAVMVLPEMINEGVNVLRKNPDYDSAVTVSMYNMWSPLRARKINKEGLLDPCVGFDLFDTEAKDLNCDRDSQGNIWFADMGTSVVRVRNLENIEEGILPQKWMGKKIYPIKQYAGLDVDYEWQIPQVEWWIRKNRKDKK
jgi:CMP-N-acetylneuraminic acid synthetase